MTVTGAAGRYAPLASGSRFKICTPRRMGLHGRLAACLSHQPYDLSYATHAEEVYPCVFFLWREVEHTHVFFFLSKRERERGNRKKLFFLHSLSRQGCVLLHANVKEEGKSLALVLALEVALVRKRQRRCEPGLFASYCHIACVCVCVCVCVCAPARTRVGMGREERGAGGTVGVRQAGWEGVRRGGRTLITGRKNGSYFMD